jgi:transcriptional regulator
MHILRPAFAMERADALRFASERGFGIVIAADAGGPRGSHLPFVLREDAEGVPVAQIHVTARNPLVGLAEAGHRFLLVVAGADAYISNDWYHSPDQVSTWFYEAVHLSGVAHLRPLPDNRQHGDELLAVAEGRLAKAPWTLAGMEPDKREAMLASIRVIDIAVDTVEGQLKVNQHKIDEDHVAIANRLASADTTDGRHLAARMRALRPHLAYDVPPDDAPPAGPGMVRRRSHAA